MRKSLEFKDLDADRGENRWSARLAVGPPMLLDGATGTELERRGHDAGLPLWSSHALIDAPEAIEEIHRDYLEAGAEVLTAATFRTQARVLERARALGQTVDMSDSELCDRAIALARRAAGAIERPVFVCGSAAPLEDCYRPELVANREELAREHGRHADNLARAGADAILIETMNCEREAVAACKAAADTGLPFLVSFVSWRAGVLLSGESLASAIDACLALGPTALLVNCLPPAKVDDALMILAASGLPFGAYAHLGAPDPDSGRRLDDHTPAAFAALAGGWMDGGARLVGGCCGTTPDHIAAIRRLLPVPAG